MISKQSLPTTKPKKRQVSTAHSFFKKSPHESIFLVHISLCFLIDHDTNCKDVSTNSCPNAKIYGIEQCAQNLERIKQPPEGFELTRISQELSFTRLRIRRINR